MHVPPYERAVIPGFEQKDRFEIADAMVHERMDELHRRGIVHGALLFGSVSFGDTNSGSDRDVLVAYPGPIYDTEPQALEALHRLAIEVYRASSVPLEATCTTLEQFQEGEHSFSRQMLQWLKEQPEQYPHDVIGNEFMSIIAEGRKLPKTDFTSLEAWLARTHDVLQKEYLQGYYSNPHHLLGQIFGVPHVGVRKTIDILQSNGFESGLLKSFTRQDIASSLFEMYNKERAVVCRLHDEITEEARVFYEEFIPEARKLSKEEYDQIIEAEIEINLPKAIHLLTKLQMIHRCRRAHLRLRVVPYEESGDISFTDGDEDEHNQPFLPGYLRNYMKPSY